MPTLYMIQLGARPKGRLIEQHDIFFGIADKVTDLIPAINMHWPEVKNSWHIDSYQAVTCVYGVDGKWYQVSVANVQPYQLTQGYHETISELQDNPCLDKLYFINLGGYQKGSIEEFHYKLLVVAPTESAAKAYARKTQFYRDFSYSDELTPFSGASHIDDKHCVDVDEIYDVAGLIGTGRLIIKPIDDDSNIVEDKSFVGYLNIKKLKMLGL
ncbi:DUF1543 domain-containing protein [Psychrobacter sp.]|uniref:DUF1543 domain-containing protein n=1 Tax=Psychrobacter sp. TaxID=56811 RepID=UPI0025E03CC6|nr:DUF1543 domain-containing protein [Psychrobacter sp.]